MRKAVALSIHWLHDDGFDSLSFLHLDVIVKITLRKRKDIGSTGREPILSCYPEMFPRHSWDTTTARTSYYFQ